MKVNLHSFPLENVGGLTVNEQFRDNFDLGKDEIWPYPPSETEFTGIQK